MSDKIGIILLMVLFSFSAVIYSDDNDNDFLKANDYYAKYNYTEALKLYEHILKSGYDNFQINYNIACCYYRLNQTGKARYYFERALIFNPFDKDLERNLDILYERVMQSPAAGNQIIINNRFIFFMPFKITALIIFLLIIISLSALFFIIKFYRHKRLFLIILTLSFFLNFIVTVLFFLQYYNIHQKKFVVTEKSLTVFIGPNENETVLLSLDEGYANIFYSEDNGFVEIKLKDGLTGWIRKSGIISGI